MKKFFITASALCCLLTASAQFTYDYLKAADDYYRKADYYSAAQYYEKYLGANGAAKGPEFDPYAVKTASVKGQKSLSNKEQAVYNLADSYRQLNYYVKAEPFYQQAASFDDARFPLADYYYATTLKALGKFEEAERTFHQFLAIRTTQDQYTEAATREIQNLQFIQAQMRKKDLGNYRIDPIGILNAEGASYAPAIAADGNLYFTTTRPDGTSGKKEFLNKVYSVPADKASMGTPVKVSLPQPSETHQGGTSFSSDGNTMYVTRWMIGEGNKTATIYQSQKTANGWSEPVAMGAALNAPGANNKQPFAMPDGRLVFASDRAGGQGGFDLYITNASGNGEATNMTAINTKFDEEAPYYHAASNTLVFSTNGRVGMGEFDLFYTSMKDGQWIDPQNFGYPVNSIKNDIYFASRGTAKNILQEVMLSSDRSAECCLQLFSLSMVRKPKLIAGTVVDCKTSMPLSGALVEVKAGDNQTVFNGSTNTGGSYNFTLDDFAALQIAASLKGYTPSNASAPVPSDEAAESTTVPILCLNKIPEVGTVEVLENVYFEYDKANILDESTASLNKLVEMLNTNPTVSIEISGHTDNIGNDAYNKRLSQRRAQSVVAYLISQGIDKSRLVAAGYGESKPVAPNTASDGTDNPEGRAKNRRTEFKVIKN